MEMKELLIGSLTLIPFLILVLIFVAFGWYLVWRLFLSRFRFVRELMGNHQEGGTQSTEEVKQPRPRPTRKVRRD
ncbi:hypothetical protein Pcinc_009302 [Petrolisthes cinctipes]|uniref:Small integral membrane protein 13 n=1 Tax=Petrolisthes cinctipes TaxID=88211 RepID=A0AAE1G792_PETCI|nr:hypothetical protein Pcinc_023043 [Petrolisthes cinctipes]KAK3886549.1 hypothetical protein Pcinc_009302 [Petrolisthes cinctipes]